MADESTPRILVIEDDPLLRESLVLALERTGHLVKTSDNEADGIRIAEEFIPHVVVSDIHLPSGDGISLLQALRSEERTALSQFILMTGDRANSGVRSGMDLGADDYLQKPFTMEEFINCVKARLSRSEMILKAESRAMDKLRATVSRTLPHELFTPLAGVIGLSEMLLEDLENLPPAEVKKMVKDIHDSGERLLRTLKSYLTILEIINNPPLPGGKVPLLAAVDTRTVINATAVSIAAKHRRGEDVVLELAEVGLPLSKSNLTTIVSEWVDNACKFSAPGMPVRVTLTSACGRTILQVTDKGRGMSDEQVREIGAFKQFDRPHYEQQGLGLGLTLTQHLIERTGARFRIESEVGKGTVLTAEWDQPSVGSGP